MSLLVSGEIELPQNTDSLSGATLYITLESIGMMGMPSTILAQSTANNISYDGSKLSFELNGSIPDDAESLNLRAHISMYGSDDVQKGDYVSKRRYNIQKENIPDTVSIKVELV